MDRTAALAEFDRERRELSVSGFQRIATPQIVLHVPLEAAAGSGFVSFSAHSSSEIEAAIDHAIAVFGERCCEFEWKVFEHDQPSDLLARLQRRGLRIGEAEELLVLAIEDAAALLASASAPRVERVTQPRQLADYLKVATSVWQDKPGYAAWLQHELRSNPDELSIYVAYVGDEPVASGRASFPRASRFAGLWTGATLPAYRRQGLYTALVRARAREAAARGYAYLMVDALPTSGPTLARLGFQRLSASFPCNGPPIY